MWYSNPTTTTFRRPNGNQWSLQNKKMRKMAETSNTKSAVPLGEYTMVSELTVSQKCDLIAELSEMVMENPTGAFASPGVLENGMKIPSRMRRLLELANPQKNGFDDYTARLAILSLLALFQDILPSYRIRLPTAEEMAVKVSKETKKTWDHEKQLLNHYQQYLKLLRTTWEGDSQSPDSLAVTCMVAMCELLKKAPHFNFRSTILTLVVRNMNHRKCRQVADACCLAIETIFAIDAQGEVALEATKLVAKFIKDRQFRVRPQVLRVFVSLPLRVHVDEAQAAKLAAKANRKKRKRNKEEAAIEDELKESSGRVDKIILARSQSDALQTVLLTYFRILKSEMVQEDLLPSALEGLAKFAHLTNMDTVLDLLDVLKTLLKQVDSLPLDASLNCILTAFQTLQGPGRELQIDQKEYIVPLYSQLSSEDASQRHTDTVLKCLDVAFMKRRELCTARLGAFAKQIYSIAMHVPPYSAVPLLAFVRQLVRRYPVLQQLLENEQDVVTSGQYNPNVEDPEHSNPFATSAWELATLQFHINPSIRNQAMGAATQKLLQLPAESPGRLRESLLKDANEFYITAKRSKKRHPLASKNSGGNRQQPRFITPRRTILENISP